MPFDTEELKKPGTDKQTMSRDQLIRWLNTNTDDVTTEFRFYRSKKYAMVCMDNIIVDS